MTVSKSRKSQSTSKEGQDRYSCDTCDADITNFIRIKCAAVGCEEIDLCPKCFCEGREVGPHKAWHDYKVIDQPTYPIYAEDWGADEELMLLEGILASGLGDWQGVSDKLFGLRSKADIEKHYREVYLSSPTWPRVEKRTFPFYNRSDFLAQKRRRIKQMSDAPPPPPPPKAPTSGPANHEITGYMPGRLEFEHELVHEAEEAIADLHFGIPPIQTEEPEEVEVKLSLIKGYYDKLDKRIRAKQVVFQRGLLDYKKLQLAERKRPKEEREMYQRQKPFARVQTAEDFEVFVDGLMYETALKKRIMELQQMRREGVVSTVDVERYEKDKAQHASHRAYIATACPLLRVEALLCLLLQACGYASLVSRLVLSGVTVLSLTVRSAPPLNLANAHSIHLLTPAEQVFCSTMRILPKPFLGMKEALVREFARRNGKMTRREAREVLKIDVNKVGRIWDFLKDCGLLQLANEEPPAPPAPTAVKSPVKSPSKPPSSAVKAGTSLTPPPGGPGLVRPPSALGNKPFAPSPLKNASHPNPPTPASNGSPPKSLLGSSLARPSSALGKKPPSGTGPPLSRTPSHQSLKNGTGRHSVNGSSGEQ
ncbi:hypothetical protein CALCODRAFT_435537 [Calocera cornea HHB12733]|uniref:Transcriptional adapter 2 n=1 Tax=Calocera cornea HHB12733 TaxID=1353952 RepID=A0A165FDD4_9BASI|nr:hypothetical protein CALCODRAFT_435537 [Calocera cornea HHB12733]